METLSLSIRASESWQPKRIFWGFIVACFLVIPFVAASMPYLLHIFIIIAMYTSLVWGLDLLVGCGLISCAQIAFWGIGSYTYAIIALRVGLNPWFALLAAGIIPALISIVISYTSVGD